MDELIEKLSDLEAEAMNLRKTVEMHIEMKDGHNVGSVDALNVSHKIAALEAGIHEVWSGLKRDHAESAGG